MWLRALAVALSLVLLALGSRGMDAVLAYGACDAGPDACPRGVEALRRDAFVALSPFLAGVALAGATTAGWRALRRWEARGKAAPADGGAPRVGAVGLFLALLAGYAAVAALLVAAAWVVDEPTGAVAAAYAVAGAPVWSLVALAAALVRGLSWR